MTLKEIEEIIRTLEKRHNGLNEATLLTLLRAGGWEEKTIKEAQMLFRTRQSTSHINTKTQQDTPITQTGLTLPPAVPFDHFLSAPLEQANEKILNPSTEPQSLVVDISQPRENQSSKKEELPHNLPLRPFETSEHVWPFSRYRDVFYGDMDTKSEQVVLDGKATDLTGIERNTPTPEDPSKEALPLAIQNLEKKMYASVTVPVSQKKVLSRASDDKIVITASAMLLAVLLLLGYMYSNGRL